jgi:hypothetical protein
MGQTQVEVGPDSQAEIVNGRGDGKRPLPDSMTRSLLDHAPS